jgi:AbrB family looped-hinge helix DNA binding protein
MTTMTSRGRLTIPKEIRAQLGLRPGSRVEFVVRPDGQVALRVVGSQNSAERSSFALVRGCGVLQMTTDQILALTRGDR